jgi:hypothetical protein
LARSLRAGEEVRPVALTPEEISEWKRTLSVWQSVGDISELAEIMAALAPDERAQVWQVLPDCRAVSREVEALLGGSG